MESSSVLCDTISHCNISLNTCSTNVEAASFADPHRCGLENIKQLPTLVEEAAEHW